MSFIAFDVENYEILQFNKKIIVAHWKTQKAIKSIFLAAQRLELCNI